MELIGNMKYIIIIAHQDNPKEPIDFVAWAADERMALGMMDAARSTLAFCQPKSEHIIVVQDRTVEPNRYIVHVETEEQGGALQYI